MSFISGEIIGKIWEYWPTFLSTCKCSSMWVTARHLKRDYSFSDTWLTAQWRPCSNLTSQHKQTLWAITSMKSLGLKAHPHFHPFFWQQAETLVQRYLALSGCSTVAFMIYVLHFRSHFFQPISDGLYLYLHAEGRVRGGPLGSYCLCR